MAEKLTAKQKLFAGEYLKDLNATQSAIRAGYSEDTAYSIGWENLKKPEVAQLIQKKMDRRAAKLDITSEYILAGIKDTVERCRQAVPVVDRKGRPVLIEDEEGDLVPAYTFNAFAALKGFELLGKHKRLFAEKYEFEDLNVSEEQRRSRVLDILREGAQRVEKAQ